MSEEHLTELAGDGLAIQKQAHFDIFQAQPLQRFGVALFDHQGHQGWPDRYDGMPESFGQAVAVARGTRPRIGGSTGGYDHRFGGQELSPLRPHPCYPPSLSFQLGYPGLESNAGTALAQVTGQSVGYLMGIAGGRKDPLPPFHHGRHTLGGEEINEVLVEKAGEGVAQEGAVGAKVGDKVRPVGDVGQVATPLTGDAQLVAQALCLFQQQHLGSTFRCSTGGHHARGPAADDDGPLLAHLPSPRAPQGSAISPNGEGRVRTPAPQIRPVVHPLSNRALRLAGASQLRPGTPAAPRSDCLPLLPSGPDGVHRLLPRRTQSSMPLSPGRPRKHRPSRGNSTPL